MNKKQKRNRFDWDNKGYRGNYGPGGQRRGDSRGSEQNRGSWQRNQNQGNRGNRNNWQSGQPQGNRPRQQPVQNQEIVLPYNFVPLNDKVIEAESYPGEKIEIENNKYKKYPLNKYHRGLYTGWIDLEITNKTPLYIRDTLTSDEISKKHEKEKKNERYINPDFFSPGGKIKIPGSSLRGMIRTLVEIVTFGKFVNFDGEKEIIINNNVIKIKEAVSESLRNVDKIDLVNAIFGDENNFSGRVFFEDAEAKGGNNIRMETIIPKILSEPKPKAIKNYFELNNNIKIRGYKLYWHKKNSILGNKWKATKIVIKENRINKYEDKILKNINRNLVDYKISNGSGKYHINIENLNELSDDNQDKKLILEIIRKYDTQHTMIKALLPGNQFIGRIRFENLANIELGALLFVLDLPQNCCHKIGMGKPLGLGSVEIKPKLHISDRLERYKSLEKEWIEKEFIEVSEVKKAEKEINQILNKFKEAFARFILEKLGVELGSATSTSGMPSTAGSAGAIDKLWEHQRMKELKSLLSYDPSPDASYPDVRVYQRRTPMKKASEINRV